MTNSGAFKDLVAAALRIGDTSDVDELADEPPSATVQLAFVKQNADALEGARRALTKRCSISLGYDRDSWNEYWNDILPLRQLARAFRIEANLARANNDIDAVVRVGLDLIELANATRRGGLITGQLVSGAIAANGTEVIRRIRANLNDQLRQDLIANLQRLEAEREAFAEIAARDERWESIVQPVGSATDPLAEPLLDPDECGISHECQLALREAMRAIGEMPKSALLAMKRNFDDCDLAKRRLLMVDAALRSHHSSTGSYPARLIDLSPRFLAPIPNDPFTNQPFLYRPTGDTFLVYSTGPKQTDGGGHFGCWPEVSQHLADLCLDETDYHAAWVAKITSAVNGKD